METKKNNEWVIFLISLIILIVVIFCPAVSYSNPAGFIYMYISGLVNIAIYGYGSTWGIGSNPEIMIPSGFAISTLVISLFTLSILSYYLKRDIKNFKHLRIRYFLVINVIILIIPTIVWIIQFDQAAGVLPEELTELGYENIWDIFTPSFGLIGVFIVAVIIFMGVLYIQVNYLKMLEKSLPSIEEKRHELDKLRKKFLSELDQIFNTAKDRNFQKLDNLDFQKILTKEEFKKYTRLSRRVNKLNKYF